jgi:oxygen-dependent protoporphyrinogen oxidase
MKRIAIIGGGISGLSAAYFLQELTGGRAEISLFEEKPRLGGAIETEVWQDSLLESGADCFLSKKTAARDLIRRLGLNNELIPTRVEYRKSFIYLHRRLMPVPAGFYLMAPQKWTTLLKMPHLSFAGKLRAAMEWFIPAAKEGNDESIAAFIRRRFGREVFERLGQPMIGGIYGGNPEKLSIRATLPQFPQMEEQHGSILRGLAKKKDEAHQTASGPRYGLFLSMRKGMEQIIRGLIKELSQVKIYSACGIQKITREKNSFWLEAQDNFRIEVDAVILALPAYRSAALMQTFAPETAAELESIPYESMATVNLIYRKSDIPDSFNGVGFVVPKIEKTKLCACTNVNLKFEGRTSEDTVILRAFVGGGLYQEAFDVDDKTLEKNVLEELNQILRMDARPIHVQIRRYRKSMPQYETGHLEKIRRIDQSLTNIPGLYLTGNAYEGIGIPDCIAQAEKKSKELAAYLTR